MSQPEGFTYQRRGDDVVVFHHGRLASTLRGEKAAAFLAEVAEGADGGPAAAQEAMARLTGNYRRGNERQASQHPRNQDRGRTRGRGKR